MLSDAAGVIQFQPVARIEPKELASLADANSHSTSFAYDRFDRLATTIYPPDSTETRGRKRWSMMPTAM
jgi:hypothetical protein